MDRAFSTLAVKQLDEEKREFTGLATAPAPDRVLDIIEPLGCKYQNPTVLLRAHDHTMPIGSVTFDRPTKTGVGFRARIPKIDEPGLLKDRVDMAWGEIRHGLIRAVSVGFRPLDTPEPLKTGGLRYPKIEIYELSTVAVPAQALATIDEVKAIDAAIREGRAPATIENKANDGSLWESIKAAGIEAFDKKTFDQRWDEMKAELPPNVKPMAWLVSHSQSNDAYISMFKTLCDHVEQALAEPSLAYAGVHQRALAYRRGQAVTHKGNLYIAISTTEPGDVPGESGLWQLAVRAGRDGKDVR